MMYFAGFKSKSMPEKRRVPHLRVGRTEGYLRACKNIKYTSTELTKFVGLNVGTVDVSWLNRAWDTNDVQEEIEAFNRALAERTA